MAIKKEYSKDKAFCKVTFTITQEIFEEYDEISLVGDFNNWDPKVNLFTLAKKNVPSISVELDANKEYQFRYLANGQVWINEPEADKHVATPYGSENSVLVL